MKPLAYKALALSFAGLVLSGCESTGPKEIAGTGFGAAIGAATGGLIGDAVGRRNGAIAGVIAGGALGGIAGNMIGKNFDEEDRRAASEAQMSAFESGTQKNWRGKKANGYIDPGPEYSDFRGSCRNYTQKIYIGGRSQSAQGVACRNESGRWEIVS